MPDSKESIKRQNYFDLKRDEWMAMDEYLLSPISEMDLRRMNEGGIANIENMTAPIGMAGGGDWKIKLLGSKGDNATLNAMRDHPFQTAFYLDMGFDKMFDLLSMLPMMKDGGVVGMKEGGMHNIENMTAPIGMAGGGDWNDQLELEIIKLESTIQSLRADEVLRGVDNSKAIQGNQNWLDYYRSLK